MSTILINNCAYAQVANEGTSHNPSALAQYIERAWPPLAAAAGVNLAMCSRRTNEPPNLSVCAFNSDPSRTLLALSRDKESIRASAKSSESHQFVVFPNPRALACSVK